MSQAFLGPDASHKLNSMLAKRGEKPGPGDYTARRMNVTLEQNAAGEWMMRINRGLPMPATDAEVSLWLALQEAQRIEKRVILSPGK